MKKLAVIQSLVILVILMNMDFGGLLNKLKESFTGKPSILGNVVQGNTWNQDLPRFGGVAPEAQMVQNPDIASPIPAPDELTPGLIHQQALETRRPKGVLGTHIPGTGGDPVLPPVSPTPAPDASTFEELAIEVLNRNNIPPAVGLGIAQAEGGRIGSNNVYNINATDSNPEGANNYESPEAGVQAFADLIAKHPRYQKAFAMRNNPDAMVEAIEEAGYAGDPKTWKQRSVSTGGAGKTFDEWSDFVRSTRNFKKYR